MNESNTPRTDAGAFTVYTREYGMCDVFPADDARQLEIELTDTAARLASVEKERDEAWHQADAFSNLLANCADTLRARGFNGNPLDERVIAMAQALDAVRDDRDTLRSQLNELTKERDDLRQRNENITEANNQLGRHSNVIADERDTLRDHLAELTKERDEARSDRDYLFPKLTESARVSRVHQEQTEKQRVKDLETISKLVEEYRILSEMVLEFDKEREQLSTKHEGGETVQPASASGKTESETPETDAFVRGIMFDTATEMASKLIHYAHKLERERNALRTEAREYLRRFQRANDENATLRQRISLLESCSPHKPTEDALKREIETSSALHAENATLRQRVEELEKERDKLVRKWESQEPGTPGRTFTALYDAVANATNSGYSSRPVTDHFQEMVAERDALKAECEAKDRKYASLYEDAETQLSDAHMKLAESRAECEKLREAAKRLDKIETEYFG